MAAPRLYADLAWVWPFVSPPESYTEEVATFCDRFGRHGIAPGARILHLGCGGGCIDFHLKHHYRVTGADLSPAMLAHARALNPEVEYLQGDLRHLRLGRKFDGVLLHDEAAYMTTLEDLGLAYRTAAAHLGPGGVLVTPPDPEDTSFETAFVFLIRDGGRLSVEVDTHVMGLYHLDQFLGALSAAGFAPAVSRWELSDLAPDQDYPLITAVLRGGDGPG